MKTVPFYLALVVCILYSCKKSNSGNSTPQPAYYLSSAVALSPQYRIVDSFYYDTLHRIDTISQSIYDSGSTSFNSWYIQFVYQGTSAWPSWYYSFDPQLGAYGDYHLLSYDPDNRITKDTSLSGSGYVAWFSYPDGNIITAIYPEGTPLNNSIDTLYLSNGNVTRQADYLAEIPGQPDALLGAAGYTTASAANPAYHDSISGSIGPLLFAFTLKRNSAFLDFTSKNARQQINTSDPLLPYDVRTLDYTLTTDSKGRLAKMTSGAGSTGSTIIFSYY
jgi:hypothetical protein